MDSDSIDPALADFLGFLARDIASHPERIQSINSQLVQRIQSLVGDSEVDLSAALPADDELTGGHPPDDWSSLLSEARAESDRLQKIR